MAGKVKYKEAKLPKRLDKSLERVDWCTPDVLVGALRNRYQLDICLEHSFYHMPATNIDPKSIRYVAIYQSLTLFGRGSGIRWYGKVTGFKKVRRRDIEEIPKDSDEWYYRFDVKVWRKLTVPISAGGVAFVHLLTNHFLLRNAKSIADLLIGSEHQFRWIWGLKKAFNQVKRPFKRSSGFVFDDVLTLVSKKAIIAARNDRMLAQLQDFGPFEYSYLEIFDLYGSIYPDYAHLSQPIEYS